MVLALALPNSDSLPFAVTILSRTTIMTMWLRHTSTCGLYYTTGMTLSPTLSKAHEPSPLNRYPTRDCDREGPRMAEGCRI